jgi:hypothetical protein
LYRGTVSFEETRKIQLENKHEDYGEEPEYDIMDEIEDAQDCEDKEESVSRRIVIVAVPNFSGVSLSSVTPFIHLSRFSFAFVSSMTQ